MFNGATERLLSVGIDNDRRRGEVYILEVDDDFEPDPLYAAGLKPIMTFHGKQATIGMYAAIVDFLRDYAHI